MTTFKIIWPDERELTEEQVKSWASDAVANGELDASVVDLTDALSCIEALDAEGLITRCAVDESDEREFEPQPDDSMDGDLASGLASAGFGTDEDYGNFGGSEE
jgi:hypothetical protein